MGPRWKGRLNLKTNVPLRLICFGETENLETDLNNYAWLSTRSLINISTPRRVAHMQTEPPPGERVQSNRSSSWFWLSPKEARIMRKRFGWSYHKYMGLSDSPLAMWGLVVSFQSWKPLPIYLLADSDKRRGLGLCPSSSKCGIFTFILVFVCFLNIFGLVDLPFWVKEGPKLNFVCYLCTLRAFFVRRVPPRPFFP